jgi:DNA polymerase-3 subunit delta
VRLNVNQLGTHLKQPLRPVYLVAGDEPLQRGEALDRLRAAARQQGHTEREVLEVDAQFDWGRLAALGAAMSLFGDKRLIELRLVSGKVGNDGSEALTQFARHPPEDTTLLLVAPKLERAQTSSRWVKAIEAAGALLQVWPLDRGQLPEWLRQRMLARGLQPAPGCTEWLAERVEGNLLAGAQEVDKLLLLQGPGPVDQEQMLAAVADSARFTVFDLADTALSGNAARCVRMLRVLKEEGTADAIALWALAKEVRLLAGIAADARNGKPLSQALAARREIWDKRRPLYGRAVKRLPPAGWQHLLLLCGRTDRSIKGEEPADPWLLLEDIALGMSGVSIGIDA